MKGIVIATACFMLLSCSKEYTCECSNGTNTYIAGKIEGKKKRSGEKCRELSTGSYNCDLK
jgi:hypothetical protein